MRRPSQNPELLVVALALVLARPPLVGSEKPHPADWVRILETRPRDAWSGAIDALVALEELPRQAVSTLVTRMDAMDAQDRRRFADGLYRRVVRPETLEAAIELLADPEDKTAGAAYRAINHCEEPFVIEILTVHLGRPHPRRDRLVDLLGSAWYREETRRRGLDSIDGVRLLEDIASGREFAIFDTLAPLLSDADADVRRSVASSLMNVGDARVRGAIFRLVRDPDSGVRLTALRVLAWHGDERALRPLLEWADTAEPKDRRWHRNRTFRRIGGLYMHTRYEDLFELYRGAKGDVQKRDYKALVEGGLDLEILDNPSAMAVMERYASDPDPFISGVAGRVLEWRDKREETAVAEGLGIGVLVSVCLLAALLGLVLFHWAFRLLGLRRLFRSLTPSPIRSIALGHVAVEGTVHAAGGKLRHPYTGELCAYYPGADREHPDVRFWIDDDTGRVLVDPRKLVMLSEDGILEEGTRVLLVGTARRSGETLEIVKDDSPRSLYARCVHFAVGHLLGRAAKTGSARLLFSDPGRCFCLWDDLRERPFACWRDNAMTFGAIVLVGVWIVVFGAASLGIVDQEFSAALKESADGFWNAAD